MSQHTLINSALNGQITGQNIVVKGWVRTRRDAKSGFSFIELNDGSCLANLQVVADSSLANYENEIRKLTTGCSLSVRGKLIDSPAKGQKVELHAEEITVYGWAPPESYPLQKKRTSFEFLRSVTHLRPRTNSLGAVARIRSMLSLEIHRFFHDLHFYYLHTPIITTSDCEGAGEMFGVTTLDLENVPKEHSGVDFSRDFFGRQAGLTVSGQLEAEVYAMALGRVYTFGPTFRAENSNTSRHLAEFWMIEPEMAFFNLIETIDLAEQFIKHLVQNTLEQCSDDIELFGKFVDKELIKKLTMVQEKPFTRISYSEAIDTLLKAKKEFEYPVQWGTDLQSEHERFLAEEIFHSPVVVTDYPKTIKPFYMRVNDDGKTVAAMDILLPGIGEIIGGSQREERESSLMQRMKETGLPQDEYGWYIDLRRFGTVPHAGFGLGFERLVQFVTGMTNIRDVIPFPRTPGSAGF